MKVLSLTDFELQINAAIEQARSVGDVLSLGRVTGLKLALMIAQDLAKEIEK